MNAVDQLEVNRSARRNNTPLFAIEINPRTIFAFSRSATFDRSSLIHSATASRGALVVIGNSTVETVGTGAVYTASAE